jgi:hypothetical protein
MEQVNSDRWRLDRVVWQEHHALLQLAEPGAGIGAIVGLDIKGEGAIDSARRTR